MEMQQKKSLLWISDRAERIQMWRTGVLFHNLAQAIRKPVEKHSYCQLIINHSSLVYEVKHNWYFNQLVTKFWGIWSWIWCLNGYFFIKPPWLSKPLIQSGLQLKFGVEVARFKCKQITSSLFKMLSCKVVFDLHSFEIRIWLLFIDFFWI